MSDSAQETPKATSAFREYCALGEARSLAKLAQMLGKSGGYVGQLERWSSAYGWVERAKLYDAERAQEKQRKRDAALEEMNERHISFAIQQQERAIKQIETLINAKSFGSQATVQLLKLATDLERLARGAPTERSELTGKDGAELPSGVQAIFYLPKVEPEEGYNG